MKEIDSTKRPKGWKKLLNVVHCVLSVWILSPTNTILEKNNQLSNSVTVEELEHLYWQYSPSIWLPFYKTLWSPDCQWCYTEHPLRAQHPCATIIRHPLSSLYFLCSYSMKFKHFTPRHSIWYTHNFMYVFRKKLFRTRNFSQRLLIRKFIT